MKAVNRKANWSMAAVVSVAVLIALAIIGWVLNIVAIAGSDGFSGMLVARAIGVFVAPLGAVLGYF